MTVAELIERLRALRESDPQVTYWTTLLALMRTDQ